MKIPDRNIDMGEKRNMLRQKDPEAEARARTRWLLDVPKWPLDTLCARKSAPMGAQRLSE
jgi:hypothetical protein